MGYVIQYVTGRGMVKPHRATAEQVCEIVLANVPTYEHPEYKFMVWNSMSSFIFLDYSIIVAHGGTFDGVRVGNRDDGFYERHSPDEIDLRHIMPQDFTPEVLRDAMKHPYTFEAPNKGDFAND